VPLGPLRLPELKVVSEAEARERARRPLPLP
jgi:hypothetical protein